MPPPLATAQVVLDGNGTGVASVTCDAGSRWEITNTAVSTTDTVLQPTARLYYGSRPTPGSFVEGTYSGALDNSNTPHEIAGGETITVEWTGGDPGITAYLAVYGKRV